MNYAAYGKEVNLRVKLGETYSYYDDFGKTMITEHARFEDLTRTVIRELESDRFGKITVKIWWKISGREMITEETLHSTGEKYTVYWAKQ